MVTITSQPETEDIIDIQVRGSYNAPHRFLLFNNGSSYNPLVPNVPRPSEYRFPRITFDNTRGELGMAGSLRKSENDGLLHPWRRPLPGVPVPERLVPVPITTLGKISRETIERVNWITIRDEPDDTIQMATDVPKVSSGTSKASPGSNKPDDTNQMAIDVPKVSSETSKPSPGLNEPDDMNQMAADVPKVSSGTSKQSPGSSEPDDTTPEMPNNGPSKKSIDYFRKSLSDLEDIVRIRGVKIPERIANQADAQIRRERIAALLERLDEGNVGQRWNDLRVSQLVDQEEYGPCKQVGDETETTTKTWLEKVGGVLKKTTRATTTQVLTSVPLGILPLTRAKCSTTADWLKVYEDINANNDSYLQCLLLGAKLVPTGVRQKDIDAYQKFMLGEQAIETTSKGNSPRDAQGGNTMGNTPESATANEVQSPQRSLQGKRSPSPEEQSDDESSFEPDSDIESSSESESPDRINWEGKGTTMRMIRDEAKKRIPPIIIPVGMKASKVKSTYGPQLTALDNAAKKQRDAVRAAESARRKKRPKDKHGNLHKRAKFQHESEDDDADELAGM